MFVPQNLQRVLQLCLCGGVALGVAAREFVELLQVSRALALDLRAAALQLTDSGGELRADALHLRVEARQLHAVFVLLVLLLTAGVEESMYLESVSK